MTPKEFVMKQTVYNVLKLAKFECHFEEPEFHFNIPWKVGLFIDHTDVYFYMMCCEKFEKVPVWSIEADVEMRILKNSELSEDVFQIPQTFSQRFDPDVIIKQFTLKELEKYLIDGSLSVEYRVKINKTVNVWREKFINFDESNEQFSDVILTIGYEKFYVLKKFLAFHSTYFNTLFTENPKETEFLFKSGMDANDLQNFLELIYGESLIRESTVDSILKLADPLDSKSALRRCENFLINVSKKSHIEKFKIAIEYDLGELKKKCMSELKTVADIRSVIPEDLHDFDVSIWNELLLKALALSRRPYN